MQAVPGRAAQGEQRPHLEKDERERVCRAGQGRAERRSRAASGGRGRRCCTAAARGAITGLLPRSCMSSRQPTACSPCCRQAQNTRQAKFPSHMQTRCHPARSERQTPVQGRAGGSRKDQPRIMPGQGCGGCVIRPRNRAAGQHQPNICLGFLSQKLSTSLPSESGGHHCTIATAAHLVRGVG